MGPLIPLLFLVPIFLVAAWFFNDVLVIWEIPVFAAICVLCAILIVALYLRHYANFAKHDPDRLQSERYRVQMQELQVQLLEAKNYPEPLRADVLEDATPNPVIENHKAADGENISTEGEEETQ